MTEAVFSVPIADGWYDVECETSDMWRPELLSGQFILGQDIYNNYLKNLSEYYAVCNPMFSAAMDGLFHAINHFSDNFNKKTMKHIVYHKTYMIANEALNYANNDFRTYEESTLDGREFAQYRKGVDREIVHFEKLYTRVKAGESLEP